MFWYKNIMLLVPDYQIFFQKDGPWEDYTTTNGSLQLKSADEANTWNYYVF